MGHEKNLQLKTDLHVQKGFEAQWKNENVMKNKNIMDMYNIQLDKYNVFIRQGTRTNFIIPIRNTSTWYIN